MVKYPLLLQKLVTSAIRSLNHLKFFGQSALISPVGGIEVVVYAVAAEQ